MRQRRVAVSSGLSNRLSTTIRHVRRTTSGAAGNGVGTEIKCLRRTRNGAAGYGLGTTIKSCKRLQGSSAPSRSYAKIVTLKGFNSTGSIAMKNIIMKLIEFTERRYGLKVS
jgi:hypothetical protein